MKLNHPSINNTQSNIKGAKFLLMLMFVIGNFNCSFSQSFVIVKDHQAKASIVIDDAASTQLRNVATLLQSYIRKGTGATLSIGTKAQPGLASIYIGNTDFGKAYGASLNGVSQDGYLLQAVNANSIVISGKTDWGTEFGVYDFLERFAGVQWLMPTEMGVDIPAHADITVPIFKDVESPKYLSRDLEPVHSDQQNALGQWGRFNRIKKNIELDHNMRNIFTAKDAVTANVQFYSKKSLPTAGDQDWQPNFSAPGISDVAAQKIVSYFSSNSKAASYSLGMNDSKNFDRSASSLSRRSGKLNRLKMEDVSDDYYQWANDVARKVNKVYPNKLFGALAYNNLIDPPSPKIGVAPNIVPFITSERLRWSNAGFKQSDIQLTNSWTAQAKAVGWYDYDYGLCYLLPRVWFHTMQQYLSWGAQNKVRYYFGELYPNWGEGPKAWLLAKLLWNPNQDVDVLLNKWYTGMGGSAAAPKLKAYYDIWEKYWTVDVQKSSWYNTTDQYLKFNDLTYMQNVPASYISSSDALLQQAYDLADSPLRKQRVSELIKMWSVYKKAIVASQKYNAKYIPTLQQSQDFMLNLKQLSEDSLHQSSVSRILMYVAPNQK